MITEHCFIAVHDVGGLVDNVADSGDDSEDEWNYFKGEDKENIHPDQEVLIFYQNILEIKHL